MQQLKICKLFELTLPKSIWNVPGHEHAFLDRQKKMRCAVKTKTKKTG